MLTVRFYNAANQPLGGPLTRAGGQTALAWYQLQLADVPVPCGAAWDWASAADVYVEQPAVWYQTWFDDFEITLLGAPVATIVQESHNDPWGLELSGLNYQNGRKNEWQANGKTEREANFGINILETPFRGYDPALGRFHQPDAITDLLPGISSYTFAFNNPVMFNDPSGLVADTTRSNAATGAEARPRPSDDTPKKKNYDAQREANGQRAWAQHYAGGGSHVSNVVAFSGSDVRASMYREPGTENFLETTTHKEASKETFEGSGWLPIIFDSPGDLVKKLEAIYSSDTPIQNIVIVMHGGGPDNPGIVLNNNLYNGETFSIEKEATDIGNALISITNLMADGGNLVLGSCFAGNGDFPKTVAQYLANSVSIPKTLNLYFNTDLTTIKFTRKNKNSPLEYIYDIPINQPLTPRAKYSSGWVKVSFLGTYVEKAKKVGNLSLKRDGGITTSKPKRK